MNVTEHVQQPATVSRGESQGRYQHLAKQWNFLQGDRAEESIRRGLYMVTAGVITTLAGAISETPAVLAGGTALTAAGIGFSYSLIKSRGITAATAAAAVTAATVAATVPAAVMAGEILELERGTEAGLFGAMGIATVGGILSAAGAELTGRVTENLSRKIIHSKRK